MTIRGRSVFGALMFFGGLLLLTYFGVSKSSARIDYQRFLEKKARGEQVQETPPPSNGAANVMMAVGALISLGGVAFIGVAVRDMVAQIGEAGSHAENALQRELMQNRDPKPKP